jgi:hypothetical protein
MILFAATGQLFYPSFEDPALQKNAPAAAEALKADVRPQADYLPCITATGVSFRKPDDVAEIYLQSHPPVLRNPDIR